MVCMDAYPSSTQNPILSLQNWLPIHSRDRCVSGLILVCYVGWSLVGNHVSVSRLIEVSFGISRNDTDNYHIHLRHCTRNVCNAFLSQITFSNSTSIAKPICARIPIQWIMAFDEIVDISEIKRNKGDISSKDRPLTYDCGLFWRQRPCQFNGGDSFEVDCRRY